MAASLSSKILGSELTIVRRFCNHLNAKRFYSGVAESGDTVTHTGQKFEEDDYRNVRFIGKEKQVNPNFAIELIADTPPIPKKERVVACDGGGGPTGHPKVYINLDKPGNHACGYCGLRFFKEDH
ncbi:NADH dehydrogenase [ubiquinone] iron-sulfur protein 6, mitochondrial [Schistocerca nitens]|uniref:NADH dehydrogenase [ubiquinone] iron-sulfur protein 6, mitochondrial n=1 Tax=Schistocerca nitens TaxID=7011 RepID=UPI00211917A7|nr:NADH dehydrogenase [ubiquinone] iron-sulfur protein 6, mitochondrial [Schistocerca nitens]